MSSSIGSIPGIGTLSAINPAGSVNVPAASQMAQRVAPGLQSGEGAMVESKGGGVPPHDTAEPPRPRTDVSTTAADYLEHAVQTFAHGATSLPHIPVQMQQSAAVWASFPGETEAARARRLGLGQERFVIPLALRRSARGGAQDAQPSIGEGVDDVAALHGAIATLRLAEAGAAARHGRMGSQPRDAMMRWLLLQALRRRAAKSRRK